MKIIKIRLRPTEPDLPKIAAIKKNTGPCGEKISNNYLIPNPFITVQLAPKNLNEPY